MELPDHLPPVAREIADLIGLDGLMRLVKAYGGIVIRVPGHGDLKQVLTPEQYKDFVHYFRNLKLSIPRLHAKETQLAIEETDRLKHEEGLTCTVIALKMQVTERTVYNRLARTKDDKQADLF